MDPIAFDAFNGFDGMKAYVLALAVGLLVGVIYALFQVRSPAPPVIALVGLLGILLGEQIPPLFKQCWQKEFAADTWLGEHVRPHVFGKLPQATRTPAASPSPSAATPTAAPTAEAAITPHGKDAS